MRGARKIQAFVGIAVLALASAPSARAQGVVAFAPTIGTIPDGVTLSVRPVVSADRRYVRFTTLNPTFIGFDRFDTFTIPAAVGGGGNGGLGGFPGGGGFGGVGGGAGGIGVGGGGGGFNSFGTGSPTGALTGFTDARPLNSFVVADPNPQPSRSGAAKVRKTTKRRGR